MSRIPLTNVSPAPKVESRKSKVAEPEKVAKPLESGKVESRKSTRAHLQASKRWNERQAQIAIRVKPEFKAQISAYAESRGESLAGFIVRAVTEQMERDTLRKSK